MIERNRQTRCLEAQVFMFFIFRFFHIILLNVDIPNILFLFVVFFVTKPAVQFGKGGRQTLSLIHPHAVIFVFPRNTMFREIIVNSLRLINCFSSKWCQNVMISVGCFQTMRMKTKHYLCVGVRVGIVRVVVTPVQSISSKSYNRSSRRERAKDLARTIP